MHKQDNVLSVCLPLSDAVSVYLHSTVLPLVQSDFHVFRKALLAQRSGNATAAFRNLSIDVTNAYCSYLMERLKPTHC